MISDTDIYRGANLLIKKYGTDAPIQPAMWADAGRKAGYLCSL